MTSLHPVPRRLQAALKSAPAVAGIVLSLSLLMTGCSVTDLFSPDSDGSSPEPAATATPVPASEPDEARAWPELRHRYFVTPHEAYDPDAITASPEAQLLADAAEQWSKTDAVHFNLEVDGSTYLDVNETIELDSVEGDLKRPNQAQAEADIQIGFASFDVGLVVIGNDVYTTNFLTGDWERGPSNFDFNPALIFDDERGVSAVLAKLDDVQLGGEATIAGTRATEITGTVEQRDISQLVAGSLEGEEIGVSVWMNADTGELIQITLSEPDDVDGDPTAWVITFSAHNEPVTIEAPDL